MSEEQGKSFMCTEAGRGCKSPATRQTQSGITREAEQVIAQHPRWLLRSDSVIQCRDLIRRPEFSACMEQCNTCVEGERYASQEVAFRLS